MPSYLIRKSPGMHQEHREVARLEVDDEGKVLYDLMVADHDVERVLSQAQIAGGLYCHIPFRGQQEGSVAAGQREVFVKTTDPDFLEALESNLPTGLVDRD